MKALVVEYMDGRKDRFPDAENTTVKEGVLYVYRDKLEVPVVAVPLRNVRCWMWRTAR